MSFGKPAFAFTPHEVAILHSDVGRSDIAAAAFIADLEACAQAFAFAASGEVRDGLPLHISDNLEVIVHAAAQLRGALYELPDDVAMLLDLQLLSTGARQRLARDLSLIVEPLEDIAGAIAKINRPGNGEASAHTVQFEERLVRAIAVAFRNRLNRKPGADAESGFPQTFAHFLEFAGRRLPSIAATAAAITQSRLERILKSTQEF